MDSRIFATPWTASPSPSPLTLPHPSTSPVLNHHPDTPPYSPTSPSLPLPRKHPSSLHLHHCTLPCPRLPCSPTFHHYHTSPWLTLLGPHLQKPPNPRDETPGPFGYIQGRDEGGGREGSGKEVFRL